jgi:alpha-D-xyloside xylohydrolase
MFGPELLVAPILYENMRERELYLPKGCRWTDAYTGKVYEGGQKVTVPAPIEVIPVMIREGSGLKIC